MSHRIITGGVKAGVCVAGEDQTDQEQGRGCLLLNWVQEKTAIRRIEKQTPQSRGFELLGSVEERGSLQNIIRLLGSREI
jgi:hypothetical protein